MHININIFVFCILLLTCCTLKNKETVSIRSIDKLLNEKVTNSNDKIDDFSNDRPNDSLKTIFLLNFYSEYIPIFANSINRDEIFAIKEKASSQELMRKIDSLNLDFDPYLNTQDAHESMVLSLEVVQCSSDNNVFCVSFLTGYNDQRKEIKLRVLMIDEHPKIVDILELN